MRFKKRNEVKRASSENIDGTGLFVSEFPEQDGSLCAKK